MRNDKDEQDVPNRCRLVLIAPPDLAKEQLSDALAGSDVASLILPVTGIDEDGFQAYARELVAIAHDRNVAVMLSGEARMAMRISADGIHIETGKSALQDAIARNSPGLMVGTGGIASRDDALELGEAQPDYVFFGRFGFDRKPDAHPRNQSLARWWAQMVEIPCILQGGSSLQSVVTAQETGADFVALSSAVFNGETDPREAVSTANELLDRNIDQVDLQQ